jgi:hypothetical protein
LAYTSESMPPLNGVISDFCGAPERAHALVKSAHIQLDDALSGMAFIVRDRLEHREPVNIDFEKPSSASKRFRGKTRSKGWFR